MKYVIYLRVSSKKQDERPQLEEALQFIKRHDKSNFKYEVYTDKITSTLPLSKRRGIQQALGALSHGDYLIGMKVDRFTRKAKEGYAIRDRVEEAGANILMIQQPNCNSPMIFAIYVGMAEEEGNNIRSRIKTKMEYKKKHSERISGTIPYGYAVHPTELVTVRRNGNLQQKLGKLVEIPHEQEIVKLMCELFDLKKTLKEITDSVNNAGYVTRQLKAFSISTVQRILKRTGRKKIRDQLPQDTAHPMFHLR